MPLYDCRLECSHTVKSEMAGPPRSPSHLSLVCPICHGLFHVLEATAIPSPVTFMASAPPLLGITDLNQPIPTEDLPLDACGGDGTYPHVDETPAPGDESGAA